mgnify:CR=1 FL=1
MIHGRCSLAIVQVAHPLPPYSVFTGVPTSLCYDRGYHDTIPIIGSQAFWRMNRTSFARVLNLIRHKVYGIRRQLRNGGHQDGPGVS